MSAKQRLLTTQQRKLLELQQAGATDHAITAALDLLDLRAATRRAELRARAYRLVAGDRAARNGRAA